MAPEPHSDPRSEWLVALLSGHLDEADPAVAAELARDPALAEQLAGLRRTEALLLADAARVREDLVEARTLAHVPGLDRVPALVRAVGTRARPRLVPWLMLVAALLVVALGLWLTRSAPEPRPDPALGGVDSAELHPRGPVADYLEFRWDLTIRPGDLLTLEIRELDGERPGRVLQHIDRDIVGNAWTPSPEIVAALPDRIYWELWVSGMTDDHRVYGATAWRR